MKLQIVEIPAKTIFMKCPKHGRVNLVPIDNKGKRVSGSGQAGCEKCHPI